MGLSGLGDLILTCSSPQSRNFTFGVNLARGIKPEAIQADWPKALSPRRYSSRWRGSVDIDMPISFAVAALLDGKMSVDAAIESLLSRPFKAEG